MSPGLEKFVRHVLAEGERHYRHFPWRETTDPYAILVSEVMLQQTQVSRVVPYYEEWLSCFPDFDALAGAPLEAVLRRWQGLGYNRRGVALKRLAEIVVIEHGGTLPRAQEELLALPGVGPATAAGVRAFAFCERADYLETNVRAVFLHELFPQAEAVPDRAILPLVHEAGEVAERMGACPRQWNYALLDYGARLKKSVLNPSRRSAHHARQSCYEGSVRQMRAWLLRAVLAQPDMTCGEYARALNEVQRKAGRKASGWEVVAEILDTLVAEGFLTRDGDRYRVA